MKIEIKETGRVIEYRNFFFADVYDMYHDGKLVGLECMGVQPKFR